MYISIASLACNVSVIQSLSLVNMAYLFDINAFVLTDSASFCVLWCFKHFLCKDNNYYIAVLYIPKCIDNICMNIAFTIHIRPDV